MKIYTKKGDNGTTQLIGGTRVPKNHIRIDAYGSVDELNSYIGLLKDEIGDTSLLTFLKNIQDRLFTAGSALACEPAHSSMILPDIMEADIELLENAIDNMNEKLPLLRNFIIPGGNKAASIAHIARCICRRAERSVVTLNQHEAVDPLIIIFLNRLSDYLFVLSRYLTMVAGAEEHIWFPRKKV